MYSVYNIFFYIVIEIKILFEKMILVERNKFNFIIINFIGIIVVYDLFIFYVGS